MARVGGARPSTIDAWQCFLLDIRDCIEEWLLCFCCPSLSPSLLIGPWDVEYVSVVLFCYILDAMLCYVWKKKKKLIKKRDFWVTHIPYSEHPLKWIHFYLQFLFYFTLFFFLNDIIWIVSPKMEIQSLFMLFQSYLRPTWLSSVEHNDIWKIKITVFVFCRRMALIQVLNYIRVCKWQFFWGGGGGGKVKKYGHEW